MDCNWFRLVIIFFGKGEVIFLRLRGYCLLVESGGLLVRKEMVVWFVMMKIIYFEVKSI